MKKLLIGAVLAAVAGSVQATPTLFDVTDDGTGTSGYALVSPVYDSGGQYAVLDHDTNRSDSSAWLMFEFAGWATSNSFGIYDFTSNNGVVSLGETLEVFSGGDNPNDWTNSVDVNFDVPGGTATANGITANIDTSFGFYLATQAGTWFSHTALNDDSFDHVLMFDTNGFNGLQGSDIVLGWEDLRGGGDKDYDDMVVGISDVRIPEPASLALMSIGLLGFGAARRRKS